MRATIIACAAVITSPTAAFAGRTFYGWLQGTDVMPERGAEIATFVSERNRVADQNNTRQSNWLITPAIGITDQLELLLPAELQWAISDGVASKTNFINFGAELRYRLVTADPMDKPDFVPLVRIAAKRIVTGTRDGWQPEVNFVGSYETGRLHAALDLGLVGQINGSDHHFDAVPAAGLSVRAVGDLRFGAEIVSELALDRTAKWLAAGPNIAWSHGRTWIAAAYGIGLYHIRDAPKINWGIAF